MMSDNSDCFRDSFSSLFDDDKLGLVEREQLKRNSSRQRVDAGEPRNTYSSIPNFSSRSSLMSSGLSGVYGALFSTQSSQNFGGLFPANYTPAKMLNELLGRQVKQSQDNSTSNSSDSGILDVSTSTVNNNNSMKMDFDGQSHAEHGQQSPPTSANDLAHHMLRNILQGKKDLMQLDQELRQAGTSPDSNQNTILNKNGNMLNNNNLMNNNNNYHDVTSKSDNVNGSSESDSVANDVTNNSNNSKNSSPTMMMMCDKENIKQNGENSSSCELNGDAKNKNSNDSSEQMQDDDMINSIADNSNSIPSPRSVNNMQLKEEMMIDGELDKDLCRSPSPSPNANKSDGGVIDLKRARVENIVSTMHSTPLMGAAGAHQQNQVNGCKKRKLYHPQQHDNSQLERYTQGLQMGLNLHNLMLNDDEEEEELEANMNTKRAEKNILKSQLRSMQEQLAEMQQKYMQLCNRMEQQSETTDDNDDATSDLVEDDCIRDNEKLQRTPNASPIKDMPTKASSQVSHAQAVLNQMMSKMMSGKLHHPSPFNGQHPLLQHIQQQQSADQMQHPAFNNAAALYLSQKLMMEQEMRAKEVEERNQQMQKQQEKVQQELMQREQRETAQASAAQQQQQQQQQQSQTPILKSSPPQSTLQKSQSNEFSERLSMLRANALHSSNPLGALSSSELEELADIFKTEIKAQLSSLVDSIVSRFVHQRRIMSKQGEAAAQAAAELNKDLMMASQLLDRKSPRTKSAGTDRLPSTGSNGNVSNSNSQSGNGSMMMNNSTTNNSSNNAINNHHMTAPNVMNPIQHHHLAHQSMLSSNGNANSTNNLPSSNGQAQVRGGGIPSAPPAFGQHLSAAGQQPQSMVPNGLAADPNSLNSLSQMNSMNLPSHVRPSPTAGMFQGPPKPSAGQSQLNSVAAAALYNSISAMNGGSAGGNPFCMPEPPREANEQNEALSLVVTPKKKRHKVTDTRITPRTVSRILAQDALAAAQQNHLENQRPEQQPMSQMSQAQSNGQNGMNGPSLSNGPKPGGYSSNGNTPSSVSNEQTSPRSNFHREAQSMLPVSLPTSVAIPNPSLHESQVFSPYSPFFSHPHGPHGPQASSLHHMHMSSSPPGMMDPRDSPPLPHPPTMLHPALLAAAHHGGSPDYQHIRAAMEANERNSDSAELYESMQPSMASFSNAFLKQLNHKSQNSDQNQDQFSQLTGIHSSTLTPMHLRKAKLMFFWVRYPSSAVLKMYFPDIKFNKNNTAQLVKWFSNFREFYYIQMEKYARQAVGEGVKVVEDIHIGLDSEIYRVLNLHYNRNNHIEVPNNFRYVVEATLKEFFRAIQSGKDTEQSWKKSIYKVISRMDDPVPDYFKSPNFLEQLE